MRTIILRLQLKYFIFSRRRESAISWLSFPENPTYHHPQSFICICITLPMQAPSSNIIIPLITRLPAMYVDYKLSFPENPTYHHPQSFICICITLPMQAPSNIIIPLITRLPAMHVDYKLRTEPSTGICVGSFVPRSNPLINCLEGKETA